VTVRGHGDKVNEISWYKVFGRDNVMAVGIRKEGDKKDIYQIAKKLLRAGLLDLDEA